MTNILNNDFFQNSIKSCEIEKEKARILFERNDSVIQFCKYILEQMEKENGNVQG